MIKFADRVKETTSTTGTGSVTLAGAEDGFRSFDSAFLVGEQITYCISDALAWEIGIGTLSGATTLARTTVLASSNAGSLVNFGAGAKDVFCTLTASAFSKVDGATSANVYSLTKCGAISDADLSQFSTTFGTDSTAAIQAVLNLASASNPIKVVFDGKFSTTGLRIKGYTTIEALPGCGAILRTGSNKSLFENYNPSFVGGTRTDKHIKILGGVWNGNSGTNNVNNIKGNGTVGLCCVMRFYGVEDLDIIPEAITNSPSYAVHSMNCKRYNISRTGIDCGVGGVVNMDGIHADGNCEDITFRDLQITSHDDIIGFNADDQWRYAGNFTYPYYPATASGPIKNAVVENVNINSQVYGLRVLSGASRIDNVTFRNIKGTTTALAMIIDNYWQNPTVITNQGGGNIGTITIDDMDVAITATGGGYANDSTININCSADKIVIKNLKRNDFHFARPTILISGAGTVVKSLEIENYSSLDASSAYITPHIKISGATVQHLKISGATVKRGGSSNASSLVSLTASAIIGTLQLDTITVDALDNLLLNTSGTISRILATNIIHINETAGKATFDTSSAVARFNLSGYIGNIPTAGTFSSTSGDGFKAVADTAPPTVVSAAVANASPTVVALTMSETINAAYVPAASAFTVSGHTVSSVAVTGSTINITCADAFVNGEAARTVAYTQPGTNNIQDASGNLLANITAQAITNNVAAAGSRVYVTLAGDASLVDNGTTKSLTGAATTGTVYYPYLGATGMSKLAAGQDGYVSMKFITGGASGQGDVIIGFNLTNSTTPSNIGLTFSATKVMDVVNGVGGAGLTNTAPVVNNHYRINRTGSVITLGKSADNGSTWTTLYTFAETTTAEIYVIAKLYKTDTIPEMYGVGLS